MALRKTMSFRRYWERPERRDRTDVRPNAFRRELLSLLRASQFTRRHHLATEHTTRGQAVVAVVRAGRAVAMAPAASISPPWASARAMATAIAAMKIAPDPKARRPTRPGRRIVRSRQNHCKDATLAHAPEAGSHFR